MSQRAHYAIATYLCESSTPCDHHCKQADEILDLIAECAPLDREEAAQQALDRLAAVDPRA